MSTVIKIKNKITNSIHEFICFSEEFPNHVIYRIQPMENRFDMINISICEPIGLTWEEVEEIVKKEQ